MRHANHRLSAILACVIAAQSAAVASAVPQRQAGPSKEYFVDEEVDYIRDAQGLSARVSALLKLANIRLVYLSMKEKGKDDKELEKKIADIHDELTGKKPAKPSSIPTDIPKPEAKSTPSAPYLTDLTRIELLRGYIEAIDEVSGDIDDAYRQKQEVRGVLEQYEKFLDSSAPLLRRFQARNTTERQAIDDARSATQESLESAQDGLKKIPKTEKSGKP